MPISWNGLLPHWETLWHLWIFKGTPIWVRPGASNRDLFMCSFIQQIFTECLLDTEHRRRPYLINTFRQRCCLQGNSTLTRDQPYSEKNLRGSEWAMGSDGTGPLGSLIPSCTQHPGWDGCLRKQLPTPAFGKLQWAGNSASPTPNR